jgi:hypothetical protein
MDPRVGQVDLNTYECLDPEANQYTGSSFVKNEMKITTQMFWCIFHSGGQLKGRNRNDFINPMARLLAKQFANM